VTKIKDILDVVLLQKHINDGLVTARKHPTLPLVIYNYSKIAAFSKSWGDGTIDFCRGLIADGEGSIVARAFRKFHNLDTPGVPETLMVNLPDIKPEITEKCDGSLGIFWRYGSDWGVATRGSFESKQAQWATEWYQKGIREGRLSLFQTSEFTPLFEIIYPENRIVIKYEFSGMVLLGMVNNHTGGEQRQDIVEEIGGRHGFVGNLVVKNHGFEYLKKFDKIDQKGREGLVLTYNSFDGTAPLKVKVKFEDYLRFHKIIFGMNPTNIWEMCAEDKDFTVFQDMPLHFRHWTSSWVGKLYDDFRDVDEQACRIFDARPPLADRKVMATFFTKQVDEDGSVNPAVLGILFMMLDKRPEKQIDQAIWKIIKPRGDDQSFRNDIEEHVGEEEEG